MNSQQQTKIEKGVSLSQLPTELMCPSFLQITIPEELREDEEITSLVATFETDYQDFVQTMKEIKQEIQRKIDSKMMEMRIQNELDKIDEENQQLEEQIRKNNERKHQIPEQIIKEKELSESVQVIVPEPVVKSNGEKQIVEYMVSSCSMIYSLDGIYIGKFQAISRQNRLGKFEATNGVVQRFKLKVDGVEYLNAGKILHQSDYDQLYSLDGFYIGEYRTRGNGSFPQIQPPRKKIYNGFEYEKQIIDGIECMNNHSGNDIYDLDGRFLGQLGLDNKVYLQRKPIYLNERMEVMDGSDD